MTGQIHEISNELKMLVYVACLSEQKEEEIFSLYEYLPQEAQSQVVLFTQKLLNLPPKERKYSIKQEMQNVTLKKRRSNVSQVHPHWVAESLKNEHPRIIALIANQMTRVQAKEVLTLLPKEIIKQIPRAQDYHGPIEKDLLKVLKDEFEKKFSFELPEKSEQLSIVDLYDDQTDILLKFLRDFGILQMAKALYEMESQIVKTIVYRLSAEDARALKVKMKSLGKPSKQELKEAQILLLDLPLEKAHTYDLFLHLGIVFFARCFVKSDFSFIQAIQYKFSPQVGYLFKRAIEENQRSAKTEVAEWYSKQLLKAYQTFNE